MTLQINPTTPRNPERDMIPPGLLRAMGALILLSLAIVSFSVLTGREHEGRPAISAVTSERTIMLIGGGAKAVKVLDENGAVLADLPHGGFVTVIQNALETTRRRHGIDPALPVRLVRYENGRFAVEDPLTGWSAELYAFGSDNKAAFERLLNM
jgi:putative photosynthetic complex assembly protein